jgi:hypothetical protein
VTKKMDPVEYKTLTPNEHLLYARINYMLRTERAGIPFQSGVFERLVIAHLRDLGGLCEHR